MQILAEFVNCANIADCTNVNMLESAKKKSMALTTIIAFLVCGVGHIYVGKIKRGVIILAIGVAADIMLSVVSFFLLPVGKTSPVSDALSALPAIFAAWVVVLVFFIWQIVNARKECRRYNSSLV